MDLHPWQAAVALVGSGGVGGLITRGIAALDRRSRSQAYTMGAVDHAVETAMRVTTDRLEKTEARLDKAEEAHRHCEANLSQVRDDLTVARREIERLMAGPIAPIGAPPPAEVA